MKRSRKKEVLRVCKDARKLLDSVYEVIGQTESSYQGKELLCVQKIRRLTDMTNQAVLALENNEDSEPVVVMAKIDNVLTFLELLDNATSDMAKSTS